MSAPPERTALYRYFDAADQLLYVGISFDPDVRWEGHQVYATWRDAAVRRTETWFPARSEALAAEKQAIRTEQPLHNRAHNYDVVADGYQDWPSLRDLKRGKAARLAELISTEIAEGRWLPGQRIPPPEALAAATEVGRSTTDTALRRLKDANHLVARYGSGHFVAWPGRTSFGPPPRNG
ncbi:hypothetical protein GCM10010331_49500 [Streptomyces xanthochromogenes]|uniref:GntR family transcriptional regulator n=1 Tax=Streptomyces xanthochromogenes TaxID=67384 RepID=UPI00167BFD47|nr:GntR family transcriptional regulator [Streptomyces xanthochromogenes]GHB55755.1 hypothetical protein GCM10010331_49500 [Streptomyces xanthochromogenes]